METPSSPSDEAICPNCGETMVQLLTLDGLDYVHFCPTCSADTEPNTVEQDMQEPSPPEEPIQEVDPRVRFRELIDAAQAELPWPEEMLEDLPEDAREILSKMAPSSDSIKDEQFSEHLAESLRGRGYVIDQDAHGVRISGGPSRGIDSDTFSPYDVVHMAADLEGGVLPLDERVHCLKCDAVIPPGEGRCQWCGEPTPPPKETAD